MSIKIHYGPPGSYKTSGAVMDDFIPAIKQGRVVVTNIRGLSEEKAREVYPDAPDTFEVISLDTTKEENRDKLARWFHWIPKGSLLILDEAQMIFPKRWKQSEIDALNYGDSLEQAATDSRPYSWTDAWEMHRHYNWDIVLTTTNIKLIRDDIKANAEGAFKHSNLATIGLKGRYKESYHPAMESGTASNIISMQQKKIKKKVWKLYDSTTTGQHKDTQAGISIFANPRILILVSVLAFAIYHFFFGTSDEGGGTIGQKLLSSAVEEPVPTVVPQKVVSSDNLGADAVPDQSIARDDVQLKKDNPEPLRNQEIDIIGGVFHEFLKEKRVYLFQIEKDGVKYTLMSDDLKQMGYNIDAIHQCYAKISFADLVRHVTCGAQQEKQSSLGSI